MHFTEFLRTPSLQNTSGRLPLNVSMNNPNMTFFATLTQCWCNIVIPPSIGRCEFDVAVSTLSRRCHYKIHDILWGEFTEFIIQHWGNVDNNVVNLTWISTLQHRCQYNILSTLWVELTNQMLQMLTKYACKESQTRRLSMCFPIPINFTFIHFQIKTSRLLSLVKAADFHTTKNKIKLKLLSF